MISRQHKTLFVHVPKCAGQSVETAFLTSLGLTWETRAPLLLRANDDPAAGPPRLAHLLGVDYVRCGHISAVDFEDFFKFSVVRNPFTRIVSLYAHLAPNLSFHDFATRWLAETFAVQGKDFWFVRPQADFVTDGDKIIVDDLLRLEILAAEFKRISDRLNLPPVLPKVNLRDARTAPDKIKNRSVITKAFKSLRNSFRGHHFERHKNVLDYHDDATLEATLQHYARDFAVLDYSVEPGMLVK